jgi:hypothetical protein
MKELRKTSSLVMDVENGTQKGSDYLFGLENRKLGRHARSGLWDGNGYPLRRYFSDVARNGFTGLQGAFQVAVKHTIS